MRGVETRIQEIRHRIFREVARMAYHTEWPVDKRIEECRLPRYLTKPRQRRNEWDMAGSDGISRVSAVFRGKSLLTNKMRII